MSERKTKVPYPTPTSPLKDGVEVPVKESTERFTEVTLDDGSVLRLKPAVLSATRVIGEYDQDGNPAYLVKSGLQMVVTSAPEHLRKGFNPGKVH